MAIYSAVPPPEQVAAPTASATRPPSHGHSISNASTATVDIEAWTVSALESLSISPVAVGTGNPLTIPLDDPSQRPTVATGMKLRNVRIDAPIGASVTPPRRSRLRRDSMERREALLKGNEGSRQRRRWENARLMHLPHIEPPLPTDWDVTPTHRVQHIPYQLAAYWDTKGGVRERVEERKAKFSSTHTGSAKVPESLRIKAKRTPAVKAWLRELEQPVRQFLVERGAAEEDSDSLDSEDEEIVFVGRNGRTDEPRPSPSPAWKRARREKKAEGKVEEGMVIDELGDDESAAFKRWLIHSISDFYGLDSKSVLVGKPAKKVVYIGIKQVPVAPKKELPRPLWELF